MQKPEKLPVFQSLIAFELEKENTSAIWIDSKNESSTYALQSCGSPKILEKVHIGRAFTPFQHHRLVNQLEDFINENTELLVLPNIDFHYLDGQVKKWEAEELFQETWEKILKLQEENDLKVLVSLSSKNSGLSYAVICDSQNKIKVEATEQGWKYDSENFEQYTYQDGREVQTTIPYWIQKTSEKSKISAEAV
ncbi:MAG: hypothetical protein BRC29_03055 [Nanohaloarchaea archaeon SW_7_43_1]|nr:MAG: hypothetical protein BRC29_03055 [Nanohaloarchaea archaeon SW_7_43_1]